MDAGEIDPNLMLATNVEGYENSALAMEDHHNMRSMMVPDGFQNFSARRPTYEYEQLQSMMMNIMQPHRYHYNNPSTEMMRNNNNMMANHSNMVNYKSTPIPPYNRHRRSTKEMLCCLFATVNMLSVPQPLLPPATAGHRPTKGLPMC